MFAKHTTAESTNLFRHERFNENKNKKMKDREIYLREIREIPSTRKICYTISKFQDYSMYRFLETKRVCICIVISAGFQLEQLGISKYSGFDVNSIIAFDFVQFPGLDTDKRINGKLIKIKAKGIYRFPSTHNSILRLNAYAIYTKDMTIRGSK